MLFGLKSVCQWLGKKWLAFIVTTIALVIVGVTDKQAAEAIGWCLVGALGIYCGANSAIEIKGGGKGPLAALLPAPAKPPAGINPPDEGA